MNEDNAQPDPPRHLPPAPSSQTKSWRRTQFAILSGLGIGLLSVVAVFVVALVVLPRLVSRDSIKELIESKLNDSMAPDIASSKSIRGASITVINPPLSKGQSRTIGYRLIPGDVHGYEFSLRTDDDPASFQLQGRCQYKVGKQQVIEALPPGLRGSAIAVAPNHLITCSDLVRTARLIDVRIGTEVLPARIVDIDDASGLALLFVEGFVTPFPIADRPQLKSGERVTALGTGEAKPLMVVERSGDITEADEARSRYTIRFAKALVGPIDEGSLENYLGGPIISSRGELVGITVTRSLGELMNRQDSAAQLVAIQNLMSKNGVLFKARDSSEIADASDLTKLASSSVCQIQATRWMENQFFEVATNAIYDGSLKSMTAIVNGVRQNGTKGGVLVSTRLGEVNKVVNADNLPLLFTTIPELIFQPFDAVNVDHWTVRRSIYPATNTALAGVVPGFRPASTLRSPENPFFRPAEQVSASLECEMETRFDVISSDDSLLRVKRTRHFSTLNRGDQPLIELHGDGIWEFDIKLGITKSLEEKFTIRHSQNGTESKNSGTLKVQQIDPAVIKEELRLAQELETNRQEQQKREQTEPNPELVAELLDQIHDSQSAVSTPALSRLSKIAIVEDKRPDVLATMRKYINEKDLIARKLAWDVYTHWVDASCVEELRKIIATDGPHRVSAIDALISLKREEDVALVLDYLSEATLKAKDALAAMGPKIEPQVLEKMANTKDFLQRYAYLDLIEKVGTDVALKQLKEMESTIDPRSQGRLKITILRLENRKR